jgi:hypothetical protein
MPIREKVEGRILTFSLSNDEGKQETGAEKQKERESEREQRERVRERRERESEEREGKK